MGFLSMFKNDGKRASMNGSSNSKDESTRSNSSSKEGSSRRHRFSFDGNGSVTESSTRQCDEPTDNVLLVAAYMSHWNNTDTTEAMEASLKEMFVTKRGSLILNDAYGMSVYTSLSSILNLRKSFPDFQFTWDSIVEKSANQVVIEGLQFSGTHSGEPFSVQPGIYPEIPATGGRCVNDKERLCFDMKSGKIKNVWVVSMGPKTGAMGLYEQLGGSKVPPSSD